ncbi:hypothetical protein HXX76_009034 [Chlamydomonas incerta]|uniref:Uncharacterized protein n=1 Tax=Chlamydomonas incerta TaxID=51695 RepID=A0A835SV54_CHLIN|nr:hypothetical protein HXX76_009034 [Chlamydomonas incerta]|eukprot:KAG2432107.1 hypothetical protein HXX76_009034 [Chlamydomonas incerta]
MGGIDPTTGKNKHVFVDALHPILPGELARLGSPGRPWPTLQADWPTLALLTGETDASDTVKAANGYGPEDTRWNKAVLSSGP